MRPATRRTAGSSSTTRTRPEPWRRLALGVGAGGGAASGERQAQLEARARAVRALEGDRAAVRLEDAVDHRRGPSRALLGLLGGEEGLEDALLELRVDAAAGVASRGPSSSGAAPDRRRARSRSAARRPRASRRARSRRGSGRPAGAGPGRRSPRSARRRDRSRSTMLRGSVCERSRTTSRTVSWTSTGSLRSRVWSPKPRRRLVSSEPRRAASPITGRLRDLAWPRAAPREELGVAEHAGQQVVEVVRDAARERADRLELLLAADARSRARPRG